MNKKYKYLILSSIVIGSLITATIPISWIHKKSINFNTNKTNKTISKEYFKNEILKLESKTINVEQLNNKIVSINEENTINNEKLNLNIQSQNKIDEKNKNITILEINNNKLLNSFENIETLIKNKIYLNNEIYKININYNSTNEINKNLIDEINNELKGILIIFNDQLKYNLDEIGKIELEDKQEYIETYKSIEELNNDLINKIDNNYFEGEINNYKLYIDEYYSNLFNFKNIIDSKFEIEKSLNIIDSNLLRNQKYLIEDKNETNSALINILEQETQIVNEFYAAWKQEVSNLINKVKNISKIDLKILNIYNEVLVKIFNQNIDSNINLFEYIKTKIAITSNTDVFNKNIQVLKNIKNEVNDFYEASNKNNLEKYIFINNKSISTLNNVSDMILGVIDQISERFDIANNKINEIIEKNDSIKIELNNYNTKLIEQRNKVKSLNNKIEQNEFLISKNNQNILSNEDNDKNIILIQNNKLLKSENEENLLQVNKINTEIYNLENKINSLINKLNDNNNFINEISVKISKLQLNTNLIKNVHKENRVLHNRSTEIIQLLSLNIQDKDKIIEKLNSEIKKIENKNNEYKITIEDLKELNEISKNNIKNKQAEINSLNDNLTSKNEIISNNEMEINNLNTIINNNRIEIESLNSVIVNNQNIIESLNNNIHELSQRLKEEQNENKINRERITILSNQITKMTNDIEKLNKENEEKQNEIIVLTSNNNDLNNKLVVMTQENERIKLELEDARQNISNLTNNLLETTAKYEKEKDKYQALLEVVAQKDKEIDGYKILIKNYNSEIQSKDQIISQLTENNLKNNQTIEALQEQKNKMNEELNSKIEELKQSKRTIDELTQRIRQIEIISGQKQERINTLNTLINESKLGLQNSLKLLKDMVRKSKEAKWIDSNVNYNGYGISFPVEVADAEKTRKLIKNNLTEIESVITSYENLIMSIIQKMSI
ncbi:hypothetical protein [Mycoplasma sp. OR1901]|uniref:hypothetical protein n=1 Tax=Mycoplasma sp. OR1901 TaxID=2742195 RepID=UPI0015843F02|nr:hypothetical protein [Mycoplasma sp. OR1901]QKT05271.1 hypothetical protein HTZ87_00955 [Mycoplasma sp. OR1901]